MVEAEKKQPEDPTGVREYYKDTAIPPNEERINLPSYEHLEVPGMSREEAKKRLTDRGYYRLLIHEEPMSKSGNDTKVSSEPKKSFEEQAEDARKRLDADSIAWRQNQELIRRMFPENEWRDIPGFSEYEMNRLGTIRGKKSKVERPLYVKLWRGGDTEVVIGKDALKEMTFGVKDG